MCDKGDPQVKARYFDVARWEVRVREAYREVFEAYPSGCLAWLKKSDPGKLKQLKESVSTAKLAYLAQDDSALELALIAYLDLHLTVFQDYRLKMKKKRAFCVESGIKGVAVSTNW